ncbi:unnamed protein product [Leptidea sinapis]|uniref:FAD/NAD(P)-binding domain-containing protein n=1 Tax=Leptidea sinapis TaxID=189913 RepID=A0A5E4PY84_9NEOP|nr:unnamed protein product [Leptidea sinapis]
MLNISLRCYDPLRSLKPAAFAVRKGIDPFRTYAKDKGQCCKEVAQAEGKRVEQWPKPQTPIHAWRCTCPQDPQPPNYDPYRIKVPDVAVPPLPPSNAKLSVFWTTNQPEHETSSEMKQNPHSEEAEDQAKEEAPQSEGLFGFLKGLFGGRKKSTRDEMSDISNEAWQNAQMNAVSDSCAVIRDLFRDSAIVHPNYWKQTPERSLTVEKKQELLPKLGYHGKNTLKYAFHEPWKPLDRIALLDQAEKEECGLTEEVFFISSEDVLPYERARLSKHMWWNADPPDLKTLNYVELGKRFTMYFAECKKFLDPVKFYRKKKGPALSIATGWCVSRIDPDDHVVWVKTLCGEKPIYYERCLLAPGSTPKNLSIFKTAPKSVRDKVCTMRTIRDLEIAYREVKKAKHVTIIGGGLLGCELAWYIGRMSKPSSFHYYDLAGDAASVYSQWKDTRLRMEHYGTSMEEGYLAGSNMTGYWTPCNVEPHFRLVLEGALEMEVRDVF